MGVVRAPCFPEVARVEPRLPLGSKNHGAWSVLLEGSSQTGPHPPSREVGRERVRLDPVAVGMLPVMNREMIGQQGPPRRGHQGSDTLDETRRLEQDAVAAVLPGLPEPVEDLPGR